MPGTLRCRARAVVIGIGGTTISPTAGSLSGLYLLVAVLLERPIPTIDGIGEWVEQGGRGWVVVADALERVAHRFTPAKFVTESDAA